MPRTMFCKRSERGRVFVNNKLWKLGICILVPAVILMSPVPKGLTSAAWQLFAMYMTAIFGLVFRPYDEAVILLSVIATSGLIFGNIGALTLLFVIIAYLYSHYMFASQSAHITAMYPALVAVAGAGGVPYMIAALSLAYFSNFCACLTHYGHGGGPIFFGAGYVSQAKWWQIGFIMSLAYLICWLGIGLLWWKVIGLW